MYSDKHEIISAGRSEAAKMKSAVVDAAADAKVTMNVGQFSVLASLVENLCEIALDDARGDLGDPRYWVPLQEYARLRQRVQKLARQAATANLSLRGVGDASFN